MDELVSFVTTVKNGEKTIEASINSILNQSYKNLEAIIIDDGSTDSTRIMLDNLQSRDSRVKVFITDGIGRVNALNLGISKSKGDFISILDADDVINENKTSRQLEIMNKNADMFLIATETLLIYNNEVPRWDSLNNKISFREVDKSLLYHNYINHSSVLMRKKQLNNLGNYNQSQKSQVDYELWLRALVNNERMVVLNEKLTAKRIHDNQSFENKKRLIYTFRSMVLQLNFVNKLPKYWFYYFLIIPNFFFSQLPFSCRRKFRKA